MAILRRLRQAEQVERAFKAQADFIQLASQCTRLATSSPHFVTLIEPTQSALMAVVEIKEKSRGSKEMTQLNTVAEGIPALGWVTLVRFLTLCFAVVGKELNVVWSDGEIG